MIFLISPSKTMNIKALENNLPSKILVSPKTTLHLRKTLQKLTTQELKRLYKVSDSVVETARMLNAQKQTARSINLFEGLVFKNLDYTTLLSTEKKYVDDHVMIFSALYGILSSDQLIMPYRLDLNNFLQGEIEDLTGMWRRKITDFLLKQESEYIVNLASEEYSNLLDLKKINKRKKLIQVDFLEFRQEKLVTISTYAKMARGKFVREVARQNVNDIIALKKIIVMDYMFSPQYSTAEKFVYIR